MCNHEQTRKPVRIIKREERQLTDGTEEAINLKTESQLKREMAETIASWVEEQRALRDRLFLLSRKALALDDREYDAVSSLRLK